jgi:hypothetical protein
VEYPERIILVLKERSTEDDARALAEEEQLTLEQFFPNLGIALLTGTTEDTAEAICKRLARHPLVASVTVDMQLPFHPF